MSHNHARVTSHAFVFRASLALAFVLSPLAAVRLAASQNPSPDTPIKAETNEVSTLTLPPGMAVPALARPNASLRPAAKQGQAMGGEIEPNGFYTQANPIASGTTVRASIYPNADVDFYAFTARAGDRVYAAIMGSFSTGSTSSNDSQLAVLASDGVTVTEFDDDNGTLGSLSSSVAGAVIPSSGTYYLKVNHFSLTNQLRPYELHFRLQRGAPTPEVEGNDAPATANPLAAGGWMTGTRNPALATEQDWYSVTLAAGDTVFLSLDLDPERDGVFWNGRLGFALFGDASNQILVVDDAGATETPTPTIPSEALFITVKNAGTYYAFVDSATAATGGPSATYNLSVDIKPAFDEGPVCAIYTSTDVPKTLGPGTGLFTSTLTVPGHPRIADLDVTINLTHALMADLDVHLRSPAGNDNGLFTDIGAAATGGQTQMDTTFDDEAGAPPSFTVLKGLALKPELAHRLAWFDGEDAGGTWTLVLGDDFPNTSGGTLISWSLRICEPPPPPTCAVGYAFSTIYSTDFETSDAGFTHTGTADEWAYGTPATLATTSTNPVADFTTCSSGTKCWKTDLTGTYNASSNQDLFSFPINLVTVTAPIQVSWAQRHQMENAYYDHAFVDAQQVGGATPTRLWEWLDPIMTNAPFSPTVNIGASAGWAVRTGRADLLAGTNAQLRFHLDSETSVNFGGLAIDDVTVQGCVAVPRYAFVPRVLR
jgi:subtilisin-like proprotein convertase family protein